MFNIIKQKPIPMKYKSSNLRKFLRSIEPITSQIFKSNFIPYISERDKMNRIKEGGGIMQKYRKYHGKRRKSTESLNSEKFITPQKQSDNENKGLNAFKMISLVKVRKRNESEIQETQIKSIKRSLSVCNEKQTYLPQLMKIKNPVSF